MAILITKESKIIIQGFTGKIGTFHAEEMIEYGTNVVGGVTPGKGGQTHLDRPVFNTVKEAVKETGADSSILFVPPAFAADSAMEAADAGIKTLVAITDGIPAHDMIKVKRYMRRYKNEDRMTMVGPNCAGVISPGKCMLGIMPGHIYKEGNVGVIGRSGTLGYEAAQQMKNLGIGHEPIKKDLENGVERKLVGIKPMGKLPAREGTQIFGMKVCFQLIKKLLLWENKVKFTRV